MEPPSTSFHSSLTSYGPGFSISRKAEYLGGFSTGRRVPDHFCLWQCSGSPVWRLFPEHTPHYHWDGISHFRLHQPPHRPDRQIRTQLQDLQTAQAGIARIQELTASPTCPSKIASRWIVSLRAPWPLTSRMSSPLGTKRVEAILHDLTFHLAPGRVLGLLGRTGSGKTTISRLLVRFYEAQAGEIRLGGVPIGRTAA